MKRYRVTLTAAERDELAALLSGACKVVGVIRLPLP